MLCRRYESIGKKRKQGIFSKNSVTMKRPGDVVEDKQLPIKAAVALAVIKNAEKQRNVIGTKATSAVFSTCSAGGAISTCSTTCSLPSGEATTTSSTALRSLRCLATAGQHKLLKKFDGYPDTPIDGTPEAYEEWLQGVEVRLKPCLCPSKDAVYSSRAARAACHRFAPDTGTAAVSWQWRGALIRTSMGGWTPPNTRALPRRMSAWQVEAGGNCQERQHQTVPRAESSTAKNAGTTRGLCK